MNLTDLLIVSWTNFLKNMLKEQGTDLNIIDHVTPDIIGIFWITTSALDRKLAGFDQFNYLFDGLLSQFIYGENVSEKRANLFFTKNFGQSLFLAHLKTEGASKSELAGEIDEQIALIQSGANSRKRILVLHDSSSDWFAELQKRYGQFSFSKV